MSEPRSKRPKITRGDDDYLPGNIIEIELYNFMTFNNVKCKPGPRLNLVIGPNGSGKSSIVCAIALGLGGEPQLLGRANSLGAFVKRGQESGFVKITLRGQTIQECISITRKIDVHNKSEWILNGRTVPKKDIVETIKKFNIQVNNLTQFLPQDRVCEFAKLTPVDLLEETEKAVGDPQLPVQHQALITKSNELKTLKRALENNKRSLDELKLLNGDIERDVERIRQREELLEKVATMKKKLPWLQYDMKKAEYMEMQKQEQEALNRLEETEKTLSELEEPIKKQRLDRTVQVRKSQEISSKLEKMAEKRMQLLEQTNRLSIQVKGKYDEMTDLRRQEDSRQQRIFRVREELLSAEAELANLPPYEPPKEKLDALFAQIFEADYKAKEKTGQMKEKERLLHQHKEMLYLSSKRLKEMDDVNNKRLRVLARSGADKIFDAYQWVQEHRQEFRKEVYGPVLLEVNVPHRQHADFLEGHVPHYIWKAFITQDARDRDYLVSSLKPFDVPIINHVPDGHHREPFRVTEEMDRLGISSRLDQVFDAPTAIKEVLISQFGLENSYIGSKLTDEKANEVQRLGIMDFWTPHNHYRWTKSRYGGHISASVEAVDAARLLFGGPDAGEIEAAKAKVTELEDTVSHLHRDLKELQGQVGYLMDEASKLHKEREEINNRSVIEKRKRRDMERQIEQRKIKLEAMEKEEDIDAAIANLVDQAEVLKKKQFDSAIRIKNLLVEAVCHRRSFAESLMASLEIEAKIKDMEENLKHQKKAVEQAKKHHDWCKRESEDRKQQLVIAKERAESIAKLTPILEQAFLKMPTTVEELEASIEDTISEASSILCLNSSVLQEYENRQRKIDELMSNQEEEERELNKLSDDINTLKERWLPTLRNLVAQINKTFSRNFKEMAVAGEVSLDECGMDFDRYGIVIKVKFRQAGQLQVLSAHHQSGGERSVSTILYLVSLQDLTNCPFRVVDEINQGMDPLNERKMFQQLVRAASQPNTPQCFLLTPKLLPSLEYSEACSILSLMNGPWIEKPSQVWSSGENWGSVMSQMGESHG